MLLLYFKMSVCPGFIDNERWECDWLFSAVLICSNCFECNEKPVKVVQCLSEHGKSSDSENDFSFKI